MSMQSFSSGARFCWQDITYEVLRALPGGEINIEDIFAMTKSIVKVSVLVKALFDGQLRFVVEKELPKKKEKNATDIANKSMELSDYPQAHVIVAKYRLEVIQPLLAMERRTRKAVKERVEEVKVVGATKDNQSLSSISVASVYRWLSEYARSGNDLRSLIPQSKKCGAKNISRLDKEVENMVKKVIDDKYYVREKVTIEDIREELAVRIKEENGLRAKEKQLLIPSKATLTRRIRNINSYEKIVAKRGKRVAKREFSQYGQIECPTVPLERVEIDHTTSDLIVIDHRDNLPLGRLTLTYCLDIATRYPLGYYLGFEPPGYQAVMECLYHAICPKEDICKKYGTKNQWLAYGIPATLMVDNAKEFIGLDLEDACFLLGITLEHGPVQTPHLRACMERMFGSLNTMFFHTLPGTTFSNVKERGDYDSTSQACVYLDEIDKMLSIFLVDVYAQRFHRGLGDLPACYWEKMTKQSFMPALPYNAEELSILLGRTTTRVIHHYGIEFVSIRYNCDDLVTLRTKLKGEKAKVKYHPADLSCLYVFDPFESRYIHVPALDQQYTKELSLWKHRVIRQTVLSKQDKVDIVSLGQAKRKIQQIVEQGRQRKRSKTRSRIARWDTAGKPTRQIAQQKSDKTKNTTSQNTVGTLDSLDSQMNLTNIEPTDGWEISYLLTKSSHNTSIDKEVKDG